MTFVYDAFSFTHGTMYKVEANNLEEYFAADDDRAADLRSLDDLIRQEAPGLERWFHDGVNNKTGGMKMQLIGYGSFHFLNKDSESVAWPIIGVAMQKNYIRLFKYLQE